MRQLLTKTAFVLTVASLVFWLTSIVIWGVVSVFEIGWPQQVRMVCRLMAMGGEVPLFFFGWLYQTLKGKPPHNR